MTTTTEPRRDSLGRRWTPRVMPNSSRAAYRLGHHPGEWVVAAACAANVYPDLWFPPPYARGAEAKQICYTCPVINQCLAYALTHHEAGVWGGRTESEREELMRRQRHATAAQVVPHHPTLQTPSESRTETRNRYPTTTAGATE